MSNLDRELDKIRDDEFFSGKHLKIVARYVARVAVNRNENYRKIKEAVLEYKMKRDIEKAEKKIQKIEEKIENKAKVEAALKRRAKNIVKERIIKN